MTKPNYTEIVFVIDKSSSMGCVWQPTINGFNEFLDEQKKIKDDEANISVVQFSTDYDVTHNAVPIQDVQHLNQQTYRPEGMTAMLDAIGQAISKTGRRFTKMEENERPSKVIFVIITDGQENSSKEFTYEQIKSMIEEQTNKYGWKFVFLGANQDAVLSGGRLGISPGSSMTYSHSAVGTQDAFNKVGGSMSMLRTNKVPMSADYFSAQDKQEQAEIIKQQGK